MIKDVEMYLDTKCGDIIAKGTNPVATKKTASLERLMNRAFTQALFQGRQDVTALGCAVEHICREEKLCISVP
jgi:hypothetical protein